MVQNTAPDPPPVTGGWQEGDPPGDRQFVDIGDLKLESGAVLPDVQMAYETWGTLDECADNAILILHALTGDSHVVGEVGPGHAAPGWWSDLAGAGRAIDTDKYFVVAANILGGCQGTTGPSSLAPDGRRWGSRFPYLTVRDQVAAEAVFSDAIGVERWHGLMGGSAGGMRALEWAIMYPERAANLFLLAAPAAASAEQIALTSTQNAIIKADPNFHGGDYYNDPVGPSAGLDLARRMAHISYRSEFELDERFGRRAQGDEVVGDGGRFAIESYLQHHGDKLARRFDANSYIVLGESMNSHDVGRGRGGVDAALETITANTAVMGIDSDRLYPIKQQERLARHIPTCPGLDVVSSPYGHDAFLIEFDAVAPIVRSLLA